MHFLLFLRKWHFSYSKSNYVAAIKKIEQWSGLTLGWLKFSRFKEAMAYQTIPFLVLEIQQIHSVLSSFTTDTTSVSEVDVTRKKHTRGCCFSLF